MTVDDGPVAPTDLPKRSWWQILKRTVREFQDDNLTDWAAALTYYGVMSLFPMLIALVAVLGIFGQETSVLTLLDSFRAAGLSGVAENIQKPLFGVVQSKGGAGALLGFGLLGSLWSASGYVGAFMRASNAIYEVEEGRPIWKTLPTRVLTTLVLLLMLALVAVGVTVTGGLADQVGNVLGVGDTAVTLWRYAKWPAMAVLVLVIFGVLYYSSPNARLSGIRWVTGGALLALATWVVASLVFALYVSNFGSYDKTYGTLAGGIILLLWLNYSAFALLFGAELNSELDRQADIRAAGGPDAGLIQPARRTTTTR